MARTAHWADVAVVLDRSKRLIRRMSKRLVSERTKDACMRLIVHAIIEMIDEVAHGRRLSTIKRASEYVHVFRHFVTHQIEPWPL